MSAIAPFAISPRAAILATDHFLLAFDTMHQLAHQIEEDSSFPLADWRSWVAAKETDLGYEGWLLGRYESEALPPPPGLVPSFYPREKQPDPEFTLDAWREVVAREQTMKGYWDWRAEQRQLKNTASMQSAMRPPQKPR